VAVRQVRGEAAAREGLRERGHAGPFLDRVDQVGGGRIGEGIDHLVEGVFGFGKLDDGGGVGGPEVLEAAEVGVLAAGEEAMLDVIRFADIMCNVEMRVKE